MGGHQMSLARESLYTEVLCPARAPVQWGAMSGGPLQLGPMHRE